MATKVKGDAIKEGSIPLSALATEVKDKIENAGGGADWNAQSGKGYIENKPFSKFKVNGEIFDVSLDPYIRNVRYVIPYDPSIIDFEPSKKIDYIRVYWKKYDVVFIDETIKILNHITSVQTIKCVSMTPLGDFNLDFEKTDNEIRVYLISQSETFSVMAESALNAISVEAITYLSEEYLPDTVLKTTPQTLSADAKNQALANLGIDPIVWKYMMNPFIIENRVIVPDYLVQLLINDNPLILNLCKIKIEVPLYDEVAGANRTMVHFCTPIAYKWNDDSGLLLQCITFYNNAYHTYYAEVDIFGGGEVYEIYEITES